MRFKQPNPKPNPKKMHRRNRNYCNESLTEAYRQCLENNMSINKAAKLYGIPRTTLRDRLSGRVHPDTVTTGKPPLFSMLEEAKLASHIKTMANYGYGYTRQECVNLATDFAIQLGKRGKDNNLTLKWIRGFLNRWPELRVLKPRSLEYSRAKMASKDTVSMYFDNLQKCLVQHDLTDKPHLIYNLDEKGVTTEHKPPYVVSSANHSAQVVTSGRGQTVTILGCINASGMAIPPYFVFPGKRMNDRLLDDKTPGADGMASETGWSNMGVFRQYMQSHFIKHIPRQENQKVLLILDGHTSHISVGLIEWALEHGIIFFFLPPHTSHILQPLDVCCYGPFERIFNNECHKMMRETRTVLTRYNVCGVACRAYLKALCPDNAQSAFKRTGIFPINMEAIPLECLAPSTVYQEEEVEVAGEVAGEQDSQPTGDIIAHEGSDLEFNLFEMKETKLKKIKSEKDNEKKTRQTIGKIVAGKQINADVLNELRSHENKSSKTKKMSKEKTNTTNKQLKSKSKKGTYCKAADLQPGPSHINLVPVTQSSDSESEDDTSLCCVCNRFTPEELSRSTSVVFTKWAQCDGQKNGMPCLHWVHLIYCTSVRVIRRGDQFFCPHCEEE